MYPSLSPIGGLYLSPFLIGGPVHLSYFLLAVSVRVGKNPVFKKKKNPAKCFFWFFSFYLGGLGATQNFKHKNLTVKNCKISVKFN